MTLVEAMGVLAVSGIVIAGSVALGAKAFTSASVSKALGELESLRMATKKLYAGQTGYTGVTIAQLVAAGAVPATLKVNGNVVVNQWGGTVTVDVSLWGPDRFVIGYRNVPRAACVELLTSLSPGHWFTAAAGAGTTQVVTPISPATAAARCEETNHMRPQSIN